MEGLFAGDNRGRGQKGPGVTEAGGGFINLYINIVVNFLNHRSLFISIERNFENSQAEVLGPKIGKKFLHKLRQRLGVNCVERSYLEGVVVILVLKLQLRSVIVRIKSGIHSFNDRN
jgi:hypothetical protein